MYCWLMMLCMPFKMIFKNHCNSLFRSGGLFGIYAHTFKVTKSDVIHKHFYKAFKKCI